MTGIDSEPINPKVIFIEDTEPTDVSAGKLWYDTANDLLKVADGADYANITNVPATGNQGEILYYDSSGSLAKLSVGSAGDVLVSGGTGADVSWGSINRFSGVDFTTSDGDAFTTINNISNATDQDVESFSDVVGDWDASTKESYIKFDLGASHFIPVVFVNWDVTFNQTTTSDITIQISNNDADWVDIETISSSFGSSRQFIINSTFRYFRFKIDYVSGDGAGLFDLNLYEISG